MQIQNPCVVSLTWQLHDAQGELIDELDKPVEFFVGGDDLLPRVEEILINQTVGFEASLHLEPEQAFGDYNAEWVFFEDRAGFFADAEVGMQFEGVPDGASNPDLPNDLIYTVTEVYPQHVVLDGNHPLAGVALKVALVVHGVREATETEIESCSLSEPVFTVLSGTSTGSTLH